MSQGFQDCEEVYPRTHGEAPSTMGGKTAQRGLSPHTRGSQCPAATAPGGAGSIPAHTGKPTGERAPFRLLEVYPRTHGEATSRPPGGPSTMGLSPHTRGSLPRLHPQGQFPGSIPAHTGKPQATCNAHVATQVYPRTHGEALAEAGPTVTLCGLSPHTRGSRRHQPGRRGRHGSIPAHTGKPGPSRPRPDEGGVYPRTHGEAPGRAVLDEGLQGLSPHTRGSHQRLAAERDEAGSIPAHTGKPATAL